MKTLLLFIAIAFPAVVCADDVSGRWQLVPATVETVSRSGSTSQQRLFRIDTATGRTWVFRSTFFDGKLIEDWSPVEEPDTTITEILRLGLLLDWTREHPNGGPFPFENPMRQVDATEVATIATNASVRMDFLIKTASTISQIKTNQPVRKP